MSIGNKAGNFPPEVREKAFELAHGYCLHHPDCHEKATEIHHKLPNTKVNVKKYPQFIKSIFNACPINHDCHMTKQLPTIREPEAAIYEWYLSDFLKRSTPSKT